MNKTNRVTLCLNNFIKPSRNIKEINQWSIKQNRMEVKYDQNGRTEKRNDIKRPKKMVVHQYKLMTIKEIGAY